MALRHVLRSMAFDGVDVYKYIEMCKEKKRQHARRFAKAKQMLYKKRNKIITQLAEQASRRGFIEFMHYCNHKSNVKGGKWIVK